MWRKWVDKFIVHVEQVIVGNHIKFFSELCDEFGLPKTIEWQYM